MRVSSAAAFPGWIKRYEGDFRDPYLDWDGYPTVGLAFLCPLSTALCLGWSLPSGELARPADIHAAYAQLVALPKGEGGRWYQGKVGLTLTPSSFEMLYAQKIASYEHALSSPSHVGPTWFTLPAVAQIARMRSDWADGSASPWPKLDAALARGDWKTAADESQPEDLDRQPPEYVQSYVAVRQLYELAAGYPGEELPLELPDGT